MQQAQIRKHSGSWFVSGLEGMSRVEISSCLNQVLHEPGFMPDLKININTRHGNFSTLGHGLSSDAVRKNLFSQLGGI